MLIVRLNNLQKCEYPYVTVIVYRVEPLLSIFAEFCPDTVRNMLIVCTMILIKTRLLLEHLFYSTDVDKSSCALFYDTVKVKVVHETFAIKFLANFNCVWPKYVHP